MEIKKILAGKLRLLEFVICFSVGDARQIAILLGSAFELPKEESVVHQYVISGSILQERAVLSDNLDPSCGAEVSAKNLGAKRVVRSVWFVGYQFREEFTK